MISLNVYKTTRLHIQAGAELGGVSGATAPGRRSLRGGKVEVLNKKKYLFPGHCKF